MAHHPCPLDAALSSPTLVEALDLARATVDELPEQASSISEVATLTTSTATVITKMSVAKKVESELRKLPLRVIELTGRGRNRTGPRPQWPPKRVRHHPCAPQQRRKPQASPLVNETSVSAVRAQRKVVPPQSLPTLDANTLQQLQDERHAMRTAFDDFATTLQQPAKTRVRCRPRRYVVS